MKSWRVAGISVLGAAVSCLGIASTVPAPTDAGGRPSLSLQQVLDQAGHDGLPFSPQLAAVSCPVDRGPVKEGSDADRGRVSSTVAYSTITYMRARPKPTSYPMNNRIAPDELKAWQVTATMTQFKQEGDGDIHVVLRDSGGHTMIAEIPYPACVPASSRWRSQISAVRNSFTHTYQVSTSWTYVKRPVTARGLGPRVAIAVGGSVRPEADV